jgi:hypothetical protein
LSLYENYYRYSPVRKKRIVIHELFRRAVMAKSRDARKDAKKPGKSKKEKKKAKQEKKRKKE